MNTSKRTLAAGLALALSGAGLALALADDKAAGSTPASTAAPAGEAAANAAASERDEGPVEVTQTYKGGPSSKQGQRMSEDGLKAVHNIHAARIALNDGYTDEARKLLEEAKGLLDQVQKSDRPMTVATEVKVGDKDIRKEQKTLTPDLIPILSQLQIVEEYIAATPAKLDAVKKARQHIKKGERKEAIKTLKLAQIGLVSHDVSMPLAETVGWLDEARKLLGAGKLYEANLELKKVDDGLVENTAVISEPQAPADDRATDATSPGDGKAAASAAK